MDERWDLHEAVNHFWQLTVAHKLGEEQGVVGRVFSLHAETLSFWLSTVWVSWVEAAAAAHPMSICMKH